MYTRESKSNTCKGFFLNVSRHVSGLNNRPNVVSVSKRIMNYRSARRKAAKALHTTAYYSRFSLLG